MEKKLNVEGMTCPKCVARVTKIIGKHEGADDIVVSLENREAVFSCEENTDIQAIIAAINDFGFKASEKN